MAAPPSFPGILPLRSLVYRYLFVGWLMHVPSHDLFQHRVDLQENRQMLARWLPVYLRRHAILLLLTVVAAVMIGVSGEPGACLWCTVAVSLVEAWYAAFLACMLLALAIGSAGRMRD